MDRVIVQLGHFRRVADDAVVVEGQCGHRVRVPRFGMLGVEIAVGWLDLEPEFLRETVVFECKGIGEGTRSIFAVILFFLRYRDKLEIVDILLCDVDISQMLFG